MASSNLPAGSIGPILTDCSARRLIWSCSVRGLPCPPCHQRGGGLLPHPFTLACAPKSHRRSALCCTFRRITPPWRYQAHCPAESGLSSALANSDALIHRFRLPGMRQKNGWVALLIAKHLLQPRHWALPGQGSEQCLPGLATLTGVVTRLLSAGSNEGNYRAFTT